MSSKITITGPFSEEDIKSIMEVVSQCEQKQPNQLFLIQIENQNNKPLGDPKILEKNGSIVYVDPDLQDW